MIFAYDTYYQDSQLTMLRLMYNGGLAFGGCKPERGFVIGLSRVGLLGSRVGKDSPRLGGFMSQPEWPDVLVYVCANCTAQAGTLPRQWKQGGAHVVVHEIPCSGKVDTQYLMHALEGGGRGLCIVACPKGECHLAQGNYRAEIRIRAVQRLLGEIGLEPERAVLVHCSPNDPPQRLKQLVEDSVTQLCALGESSIRCTRNR